MATCPTSPSTTPSGHVLLDGTLGSNVQDFRTYLSPWSGQPTTPPSIAGAKRSGVERHGETSWNGATEVASWQVLAGSSPSSLTPLMSVPKVGFQTHATVVTSGCLRGDAGARREWQRARAASRATHVD